MTDLRLDGQSIAITGALGDIGSAIAHEVLRLGAAAMIIDLAAEADARDLLEPFHRHGPEVRYARADVRDFAQVEAALAGVPDLTGVVGNAGIGIMAPFLEMTPRIWSEQIDTNLGGVFYSVDLLPGIWRTLSLFNPILYMINAFRYGMIGTTDVDLNTAFIMMGVFVFVLFGVCAVLIRKGVGIRE